MLENDILDYFPDGFKPTKFDEDADIVLMRSFWDKNELLEVTHILSSNNILFSIEFEEAIKNSTAKFTSGAMDLFIKEDDLDKAIPIMEKFDEDYALKVNNSQKDSPSSIPLFIRVILFMVLLTLFIIRCSAFMLY